MFRIVFTAVVAGVCAVSPLRAQDAPRSTGRAQITVSGEGTAMVPPDTVRMRAGVVTEARSAREAGEANGQAMSAVLAAVKSTGMPDKDVQTTRYAIQPLYGNSSGSGPSKGGGPRITGFQATNSIVLTVRQPDKVAELIDRMVAAGANSLGGIEFSVADKSTALDAARTDAVADARRKAELYARAAGVTVGQPITIVENNSGAVQPVAYMRMSAAPAAQTPITPGEMTLRVSITASFELLR